MPWSVLLFLVASVNKHPLTPVTGVLLVLSLCRNTTALGGTCDSFSVANSLYCNKMTYALVGVLGRYLYPGGVF